MNPRRRTRLLVSVLCLGACDGEDGCGGLIEENVVIESQPALLGGAVGEEMPLNSVVKSEGAGSITITAEVSGGGVEVTPPMDQFGTGMVGYDERIHQVRCTARGVSTVTLIASFTGEEGQTISDSSTTTVACVTPGPDAPEDLIYSISQIEAGFRQAYVDMRSAGASKVMLSDDDLERVASLLEDTNDPSNPESPNYVAGASDTGPGEAGEYVVVRTRLGAPIPLASPDRDLTYAAVFESDDIVENDWTPKGPFDWDYYQGADLWYEAHYDHAAQAWGAAVTQVGTDQSTAPVGSGSFFVAFGDIMTWYIPRMEFQSDEPRWRASSFATDGSFEPEESGGDVNGADPTEPMSAVD